MVALKIQNFGGMIPAFDPRLLPDAQAEESENSWVYSGALEGFRTPVAVHTCATNAVKKVFRIPDLYLDKDHIVDSFWMEFDDADVDVVRSPTIDDVHERYYWCGATIAPTYNTKARIRAGDAPYVLGIPAPSVAPGLASVTGGTAPTEDRAYVYTWVSTYGEEGPPSPPVTFSGNANGTWNLTFTAPTSGDTTGRSLAYTRIYRAVTSSDGSATYFFVAEIAITTLSYGDAVSSVTVAASNTLQSTFWEAPPNDLDGMIAMPNGMIAGWRNNEVWFCEPYRPHAWPSPYTVAVDYPIIGLGVIGQTLIVCTSGSPYAISGTNPATMAMSRIAVVEPCTSRGSIVSTPRGVAYASPNGIALAVPGSVTLMTRGLIHKDKWADYMHLPSLRAVSLNDAYYAWGSVLGGVFNAEAFETTAFVQQDFTGAYQGAHVDTATPRVAMHLLTSDEPTYNCFADVWTGETFLIRDGVVYWIDVSENRAHEPYTWTSKIITLPSQQNMGAMKVWFETYPDTPAQAATANTTQGEYELADDQYGVVRLYSKTEQGDMVLRFTRELRTSGELFRLPSGYKAQYYQIKIDARVKVTSIDFSSTPKELTSV